MYEIIIDNICVAIGLSVGELNQWLLDIDNELSCNDRKNFRTDLNYEENVEICFEDYLYNTPISNQTVRYKEKILNIVHYKYI